MSYRVKSNYRRLGDYIELIDERNVDLEITLLLGLSISKQFIPSVANIIGTDMRNYKIIRRGQFACSIMQVRRDGKMPVALLSEFEEAIISQAYPVFRVKDESLLLPEYLMMWFSRSEFDRQATFHAVGGVRGSLEWDDFIDFELPIPSLEKQNEIVREYNTIVKRIDLNETLNQKLEETAQALYKHWFVDFEFPNENGNPYKSSGGEMVYCEEVDGEVPEGWESVSLLAIMDLYGGGTPKTEVLHFWNGNIPFFTPKDVTNCYYTTQTEKTLSNDGLKNCSTRLFPKNTILVTARGTVGAISIAGVDMSMNQSCYAFKEKNNFQYYGHQFLLRTIEELKQEAVGAVFSALVTKDFETKMVLNPNPFLKEHFDLKVKGVYNGILNKVKENNKLKKLQSVFLSKMSKVENTVDHEV